MNLKFHTLLGFLLFTFSLKGALLEYQVTEHPYRFSTYFEMRGKTKYEGKAIKPAVSVRTCYDLYDAKGVYIAQGICRALSLGSVYSWAREIDVYDHDGKKIGFIEGKLATTTHARFNIYDFQDNLVAIAYLDDDSSGFNVVAPTSDERPLAILKRQFIEKAKDSWNVTSYEPTAFDVRILKIFSAFSIDHQKYFKADT